MKSCAVLAIEWDGRVLILLRARGARDAGTFCFPGGHGNPGEVPPTTALRETAEETGLLLQAVEHLSNHTLETAILHVYASKWTSDTPPSVTLSREHDGYLWVDPLEAWVYELPLTGGVTRLILDRMRGRLGGPDQTVTE